MGDQLYQLRCDVCGESARMTDEQIHALQGRALCKGCVLLLHPEHAHLFAKNPDPRTDDGSIMFLE